MSDLGENADVLRALTWDLKNDWIGINLGVGDGGYSTLALLDGDRHHWLVGVDARYTACQIMRRGYYFMLGDSVDCGRLFLSETGADIIFVDTIHARLQALAELCVYWPMVSIGGYMVLHDTDWRVGVPGVAAPEGPNTVLRDGEMRERWCGKDYGNVADAIREFFSIENFYIGYQDPYIKVTHHKASYGMTVIQKRRANADPLSRSDLGRILMDRYQLLRHCAADVKALEHLVSVAT